MTTFTMLKEKFDKLVKESEGRGIGIRAGQDKKGHYILFDEELMDEYGYYTGKISGAIIYGHHNPPITSKFTGEIFTSEKDILFFNTDEIKFYGTGAKDPYYQDYNFEQIKSVLEEYGKERKFHLVKKGKKGWFLENLRHSLARKGIKTGRKRK